MCQCFPHPCKILSFHKGEHVQLFEYEKKVDELFDLLDVDAVDGILTLKEFNAAYPNMSSESIQ